MPSSIHYVAVRLAGMVRSHAHDDDQAHNGIGHIMQSIFCPASRRDSNPRDGGRQDATVGKKWIALTRPHRASCQDRAMGIE
jgi:hypothetical protein